MYLLIDNYDSFTYNIYQELSEITDQEIRVLRNDAVTIEEIAEMNPKSIILSPGPGVPRDAGIIVDLVRRFAGQIPILGICLGHQAIAAAFGGRIVQAKRIVHGKTDSSDIDDAQRPGKFMPVDICFHQTGNLACIGLDTQGERG